MLVGEHVLAERGAERRQPSGDLRKSRPRLGVEARALAAEGDVVALQHPHLLGIEAERNAPREQVVHPAEQRLVQIKPTPMPGEQRRDLALDRLQGITCFGARQHMEDGGDLGQGSAAALKVADRVFECRWAGGVPDRRDFLPVQGQRPFEGRGEIADPDSSKGRNTEWAGPLLQQWVRGVFGRGGSHGGASSAVRIGRTPAM